MHTCPNCGYCPHCGRSDKPRPRPIPVTPYPWYGPYTAPVQPFWQPTTSPYRITC